MASASFSCRIVPDVGVRSERLPGDAVHPGVHVEITLPGPARPQDASEKYIQEVAERVAKLYTFIPGNPSQVIVNVNVIPG